MKILITGAAGFIGSRVAEVLAGDGAEVLGVDCINDYYDQRLKMERLRRCGFSFPDGGIRKTRTDISGYDSKNCPDSEEFFIPFDEARSVSSIWDNLSFVKLDVRDPRFEQTAAAFSPDVIVHLAAQPGVRYSISNPEDCLESNVMSFMRVLEVCRQLKVRRMLYASSSSVYGNHSPQAFRESDMIDSPKSVYATSKRTNEMLAGVYSEMYGIRMVGLRFFSVYGEWGRPDMAPYLFADAIIHGRPIRLFNGGQLSRDFTYIDDVAECVRRIVMLGSGIASIGSLHEVINIGHGVPTLLTDFLTELQNLIGRNAIVNLLPMQPGEVRATLADTAKLRMQYGYQPATDLATGLSRFIDWLRKYQGILAETVSDSACSIAAAT